MSQIPIEMPPAVTDPMLREYLYRQLNNINIALGSDNYFPPRGSLPVRVRIGEVHYFKDAIPSTDITAEGLWLHKSTGWVQLG